MFRLAAFFSIMFGISALLLFAFIYWQTAIIETSRVDQLLVRDINFLAHQPPEELAETLASRLLPDLRRVALFDKKHTLLVGNLGVFPDDLRFDGIPHRMPIRTSQGRDLMIRSVGLSLPDGRLLVIARPIESVDNLQRVVLRALGLGLIPAILLALVTGALASLRTQRQLQQVHQTAERIMQGDLRERLPTRGSGDDFDRLAGSVNHMLDEIARLMEDLKSTGDTIAHDLRTPLARVRSRLERARATATTQLELRETVDRAIIGLDQALRLISALLRINEIEGGRRRAAFAMVQLAEIAEEVAELYQPLAEEKGLNFILHLESLPPIQGDRDLLCELLSNLIDNAIKFTPPGGSVSIITKGNGATAVVRVVDNGPGIPLALRDKVFQRFYRYDSGQSVEGFGLGLSLVDAIVKLHGFQLTIEDNQPGCIFIVSSRL
jgi:signal transduction histidine kinase